MAVQGREIETAPRTFPICFKPQSPAARAVPVLLPMVAGGEPAEEAGFAKDMATPANPVDLHGRLVLVAAVADGALVVAGRHMVDGVVVDPQPN